MLVTSAGISTSRPSASVTVRVAGPSGCSGCSGCVVCVSQGTLFSEDYNQSLRILADVCGVDERAEQLIAFISACLDDLSERAKSVSDEAKPIEAAVLNGLKLLKIGGVFRIVGKITLGE